MTNMLDGAGTTKYTYDSAGLLLNEDGPFASDTVTNGYSNRLRKSLSLQQPTGFWTNGFVYDITKRLTNVTSQAGAFGYLYDPTLFTHHASLLTLPNTSYVTNAFDSDARLIATYLKKNDNSDLDYYLYVYNPANQRTNLTRADSSTVGYAYDPIGQLKVADSSVNTEDRGYTYDSAWNLNYRTNNGLLSIFIVDNKNQLTNVVSNPNTYDQNGNMTAANNGHNIYVYDDENRLVQWFHYQVSAASRSTGDQRTDFVYDGLGRLRKRLEYSLTCPGGTGESIFQPGGAQPDSGGGGDGCLWSLPNETDYIYDGWRVVQERDGNNTPTVSYTRGNDLSGSLEGAGGIGGLLARSSGYSGGNPTAHNYYFADGNGNITYMLNSSQAMVASYRYDPFGNTISLSGTLANANVYRFSSKEIHANSGTYYYGYRFYDPSSQRWINRDPIQEYSGVNLYTFVYNNPLTWVDLLGLAEYSRVQVEAGINPKGNPIITQLLNLGCVGLCSVYQQSGCTSSLSTPPEKMPGTTCFLTEGEARAYKCPPNKKPFVFGKFGQWERGTPVKGPDGRVPNDSIISARGQFNYVTVLDTGRWRYAWMDHRIEDGPQTVYCENEPFQTNPTYPREIWCVTCKCP